MKHRITLQEADRLKRNEWKQDEQSPGQVSIEGRVSTVVTTQAADLQTRLSRFQTSLQTGRHSPMTESLLVSKIHLSSSSIFHCDFRLLTYLEPLA